jgi:hypothetical protein
MVLMPKPRNHRGDFETQITKQELLVLRPKLGETVATDFEAKPAKTVRVVLRPNYSQTVYLGFEAQSRKLRF